MVLIARLRPDRICLESLRNALGICEKGREKEDADVRENRQRQPLR